jgi:hypothetical protein
LTAKNNKQYASESLYDQRKAKKWQAGKQQIDQYDPMQIVRATDPTTWVASFQRVNLDSQTRVDFPVFCKKILGGFLRASKSVKEENVTPTAT